MFKPHVTVACVVHARGKFLVVEESINGKALWNQPAGHLEANETLLQAAKRELWEETGIHAEPQHFIRMHQWIAPDSTPFLRFLFAVELILAAVMSTLSCQLLVCSSVLTEDFYRVFIRPHAAQRELVWIGRLTVVAVSVVAILIATDPNNLVLSLVSYAWGGFGASFGPIIILSLLWKGVTRNGALVGIIVGALTVLIWHQGAWWGMYEIIPGFVLSFIAIIVVSLLDPNKPSATMIETFDKVQHKLEDVKKQLA